MPPDGSAAHEPRREGIDAGDADHERFVFGADPVRERWWGRPLAETRWCLELGRLLADPVWQGVGISHGDGRPVVLMPGLLAGDQTLGVMAMWLRRIGYRPRFARFVTNTGCSDRALDRVERTVDELWRSYGRRVALIGHSRGGHFARALAARRPDRISHAISMGADLQGLFGISSPTRAAVGIARRGVHVAGRSRDPDCFRARCSCGFIRDYTAPFPVDRVRLTSIYTKGDGVVRWERAIVEEADCVEVTGSHLGLMANRKAYRVIAKALALPELTGATHQE